MLRPYLDDKTIKLALVIIAIVYFKMVWTHSVYAGRLDFDIFSNGGYIQIIVAVIGATLLTVATLRYNKMRKIQRKKNKPKKPKRR